MLVNSFRSFTYKALDNVDSALDRLTSYRLVLYLLILYVLGGVGLASAHKLGFTAWQLLGSVAFLLIVCRAANTIFAKIFDLPRNLESDLITALILSLIMTPATSGRAWLALAGASIAAMAAKYVLVVRRRHIFNPAALGAFVAGWGLHNYASWWVGTKYMAPLTIIGGLLIMRKVKRGQIVAVFGSIFVAYQMAYAPAEHLVSTVWEASLSGPLIFLATVMLTEPLTSPSNLNPGLVYAIVTGSLFSVTRLHVSPEEALLIGNGLSAVISPAQSWALRYVGARKEAEGIYSFFFKTDKKLKFKAGQYMEWTVPGVRLDGRGNRRYLTIVSAPTESVIAFSVRVPQKPSRFKQTLLAMKPGQTIIGAQLAGEFTLPPNPKQKLAFVAGGIGITPFHSMVKELMDKKQTRDISLIYSANSSSQFAFTELFNSAKAAGVKPTYVPGRLDPSQLARLLPDYRERRFMISGPQGFVAMVREGLVELGLSANQIVTDFFPGYS